MGAGPAEARLEPARSSRPAPTGRRLGGLPPTRRAAAETAEYPCQVAKGRPITKCLGYASLLGMTTVVERLCERCLGTYQADADSHCLAMGELAIGQPGTVVGFRDRADMTVAWDPTGLDLGQSPARRTSRDSFNCGVCGQVTAWRPGSPLTSHRPV